MRPIRKKNLVCALLVILLSGIVLFALLIWFNWNRAIDWDRTVENVEKATDTFEHVTTGFAFIIAGIWAYRRYVKTREDKPRLEPSITARLVPFGNTRYVLVTLQIRNTGVCDVDISQKGTGLDISPVRRNSANGNVVPAVWTAPPILEVFKNHEWIEPGETITDQVLLDTPVNEQMILKIELHLYSKKNNVRWQAISIIPTMEATNGAKSLRRHRRKAR